MYFVKFRRCDDQMTKALVARVHSYHRDRGSLGNGLFFSHGSTAGYAALAANTMAVLILLSYQFPAS